VKKWIRDERIDLDFREMLFLNLRSNCLIQPSKVFFYGTMSFDFIHLALLFEEFFYCKEFTFGQLLPGELPPS